MLIIAAASSLIIQISSLLTSSPYLRHNKHCRIDCTVWFLYHSSFANNTANVTLFLQRKCLLLTANTVQQFWCSLEPSFELVRRGGYGKQGTRTSLSNMQYSLGACLWNWFNQFLVLVCSLVRCKFSNCMQYRLIRLLFTQSKRTIILL